MRAHHGIVAAFALMTGTLAVLTGCGNGNAGHATLRSTLASPASSRSADNSSRSVGSASGGSTLAGLPAASPVGASGFRVGNLALAAPLYTSPTEANDTIDVAWGTGNQTIELHKLFGLASHSATQVAAAVLNLLAAAISSQLQYSPQLLPYLTVDQQATQVITELNHQFRAGTPTDAQLKFFDSAAAPVTFSQTRDPIGRSELRMTSGVLYAERVIGGRWQDPAGDDPARAVRIATLTIVYQPNQYTDYITLIDLEMTPPLPQLVTAAAAHAAG